MLSSLDENSSKDNSRIGQLDKDLATLRKNLDEVNQERAAIMRLLESASSLTADGTWQELERNEEQAVFVCLTQAYLMRNKESTEEEVSQSRRILEANRGQDTETLLSKTLLRIVLVLLAKPILLRLDKVLLRNLLFPAKKKFEISICSVRFRKRLSDQ